MNEELELFARLGGSVCLICGERTDYIMRVMYYDCYGSNWNKPHNRTRYIATCTGLKCITRFLDVRYVHKSDPCHLNTADTNSHKCAADLDPSRRRWSLTDVFPPT